jgi:predicted alpha/beta hydrolase family esterase
MDAILPRMADIILFHHAQGLTPGVQAFADQVHVTEDDPWTDIDEAQALATAAGGQLLVYPGDGHLVTDSSQPDYDPEIAAEMLAQTLSFLERVEAAVSPG